MKHIRIIGVIIALVLGVGVVWQGVDIDAGRDRGHGLAGFAGTGGT